MDGKIRIYNGGSNSYWHKDNKDIPEVPKALLEIADEWYELSSKNDDVGACVLGAGMNFIYEGKSYRMLPQSPWQGEGSWTPHKEKIKEKLESIGAINVNYEYGIMD